MKNKIDKKIIAAGNLLNLTFPADISYLQLLQNATTSVAKWFDFSPSELINFELIVEEALVGVINNSFDPGEYGEITFRINYHPGALTLAFEDKGLPTSMEMLENDELSSLGILIIKHLADEFRFINLGKGGKRLEIVKNIPEESISTILETTPPKETIAAPPDEDLHFRLLTPEDAVDLARLTYRAYGYTYTGLAYLPEKLKEQLEFGYMKAVVVHNPNGLMIANLGLFFDKPGAKVADSGMAIVDPSYRGHNLFKRMKAFAIEHGRETGMYGLYSESVTIHPYTQKGNITLGAKEIGCLLAFIGEHITFKKINEDGLSQRQAVMLYYLKINQEPERDVFIPQNYHDFIADIYKELCLKRNIYTENSGILVQESRDSIITTSFKPDFNIASIIVEQYGVDIVQRIKTTVKEFCIKKVDTIYLELPLCDANTIYFANDFRKLGFFMGGVIPEFRNGDVLKLQYLNNIYIDPAKIVVASERGERVLSYILSDREQAG